MLDIVNVLDKMPPPQSEDEREERLIEGLQLLAYGIGHYFSLRHDEVAIQVVSNDRDSLRFVIPQKLYRNTFPVDGQSIAGSTVVMKKIMCHNRMVRIKRLSFYEKIKTVGVKPLAIQKMATIPVEFGDEVVGVIQLSRRAETLEEAGPDFKEADLDHIKPFLGSIAQLIIDCRPSDF